MGRRAAPEVRQDEGLHHLRQQHHDGPQPAAQRLVAGAGKGQAQNKGKNFHVWNMVMAHALHPRLAPILLWMQQGKNGVVRWMLIGFYSPPGIKHSSERHAP